jgi:hypothetical protein
VLGSVIYSVICARAIGVCPQVAGRFEACQWFISRGAFVPKDIEGIPGSGAWAT